ncbi:MAG: hypothetical protein FGM32_00630 [Candidatus Kapabacteria bacterium]|nr:hypothetical protein [Candidatus Kapabacteria bacterium]
MDQRQRRRVEIYFVLYLLALVLLMPDGASVPSTTDQSQTPLRIELFPERVRLTCEVKRDSSGAVRLLRLDSANVIHYSPQLTNVTVRAVIEDVASGQSLTIDERSPSTRRFASLRHDPSRSAFVFSWSPLADAALSKTFRVTVYASGTPVNGVATDAMQAVGSTQFVLMTVVNDQQPPQLVFLPGRRDTLVLRESSPTSVPSAGAAEFWLEPARDNISSFASAEWTNRISIGGADPQRDLLDLPSVRLGGETMQDVSRTIDQRTLVVRGRAPRTGTAFVEVSARRSDGRVATTRFTVSAMNYATPSVPDVVYPGVEYTIDPKLPADRSDVRAVIRDGGREIVSVDQGLIRVRFAARDTGKTMLFERSVNGSAEVGAQPLIVRPFPGPVIREIRRDADPNKRMVVVQFFSNERGENRPQLRVVDGNATAPRKLSGYLRPADNTRPVVAWVEVFEITRRDASKPFAFRVQAADERGKESAIVSSD